MKEWCKRNVLPFDEAMDLAKRMESSVKIQNAIEFGDMHGREPEIDIFPDEDQYYDPGAKQIHLGVQGILDLFAPETEEEFVAGLSFARQHESQHAKSTASVPYAWGINRGTEIVLEYISAKVEPSKRRFKNKRDYQNFVDHVLPGYGINLSYRTLQSIIAGIENSLEDGRIERIRASRYPGFAESRTYHRGLFWDMSTETMSPYDDVKDNSGERLRLIVNEILMLATCQIHSKGFVKAYAGTPLMDEINELKPLIALGVMAGRTRDMAIQTIEISRTLAPYLFEASKAAATDKKVQEALDELIKNILESILSNMDRLGSGNLSESAEDTDNGGAGSTFSHSDLVITLPDEVFDKLKENSKNAGGGGGIMVLREHPLEKKDSDSNGSGASVGQDSTADGDADISSVLKDMEDAAARTQADAEGLISRAEAQTAHSSHASMKEVPDNTKPISPEAMKDICSFQELHRKYKVKTDLPPVLAAKGTALLRKNSKYFKSLSTPTTKFQDSGSVDPSRIYGLSFGDTEIFQKIGKDRKFDGCAYILVDNSGSMYGQKRTDACKAAALIEEAFRGLIPIKIVAFDYDSCVIHEVVKNWNESLRKNCCYNFCLYGRDGCGNADAYDIRIATRELMARPESKKMLVVLSDGMPAEASQGQTMQAIRDARKSRIQVNGIYFSEGRVSESEARAFKGMYEKDYIICESENIADHLEKVFYKFSRS